MFCDVLLGFVWNNDFVQSQMSFHTSRACPPSLTEYQDWKKAYTTSRCGIQGRRKASSRASQDPIASVFDLSLKEVLCSNDHSQGSLFCCGALINVSLHPGYGVSSVEFLTVDSIPPRRSNNNITFCHDALRRLYYDETRNSLGEKVSRSRRYTI